MARLNQDTQAEFHHGITGQHVSDDILEAGTEYEYEGPAGGYVDLDGNDVDQASILVKGYRYIVKASDLQ